MKLNQYITLLLVASLWNMDVICQNISRQQTIQNAEMYQTHLWNASSSNIWNLVSCGGKLIRTPSRVVVGQNMAFPYCWDGNSTIAEFEQELLNGKSAGDDKTNYQDGAEPLCSVGHDCSGFTSRAWGLTTHYFTYTMYQITTQYASISDLKVGDVMNKSGSHVRMVHTKNPNGSIQIIESASSGGGVQYANYTLSGLQGMSSSGYVPRGYNNIEEALICSNAVQINCGQIYHGNASTAQSYVNTYGCNNWSESGPERIHKIVTTQTGNIEATVSNYTGDLDVFILSSCSPNSCVGTNSSSSSLYTNAPAGTYYIVVDADDGSNSSYDLIVDANCSTTPPPNNNYDLTIGNIFTSGSSAYNENGYVPFQINIANNGLSNLSTSFEINYYLSLDGVYSANDYYLSTYSVNNINSGQTLNLQNSVQLPTGIVCGTYYIIAMVDYNQSIVETNESNNSMAMQIMVQNSSTPLAVEPKRPYDNEAVSDVGFLNGNAYQVDFSWRGNYSTNFEIVIAQDPSLTQPILTEYSNDTVKSILLPTNYPQYYWAVRSYNCMGWGTFSSARLLTEATASIEEDDWMKDLFVYPNPFDENITIKNNLNKPLIVKLRNVLGQDINAFSLSNVEINTIDTKSLPKGIYHIVIEDIENKIIGTKKLIKE